MGLNSGGVASQSSHRRIITHVFSAVGSSSIVDAYDNPLSKFSIQVIKTGSVTSYSVVLEVSLDGVNFTQVLSHTNLSDPSVSLFTGAQSAPSFYFRVRCTNIETAGGSLTVHALGMA